MNDDDDDELLSWNILSQPIAVATSLGCDNATDHHNGEWIWKLKYPRCYLVSIDCKVINTSENNIANSTWFYLNLCGLRR